MEGQSGGVSPAAPISVKVERGRCVACLEVYKDQSRAYKIRGRRKDGPDIAKLLFTYGGLEVTGGSVCCTCHSQVVRLHKLTIAFREKCVKAHSQKAPVPVSLWFNPSLGGVFPVCATAGVATGKQVLSCKKESTKSNSATSRTQSVMLTQPGANLIGPSPQPGAIWIATKPTTTGAAPTQGATPKPLPILIGQPGANLVLPSQLGGFQIAGKPVGTTPKQVAVPTQLISVKQSPQQPKPKEKTTTSVAKPQEVIATPKSAPFMFSQSGATLFITPSQPGASLTVAAPTRTEVTSKQVASPKQLQSKEKKTTSAAKPQEIVATPKSTPFVISQSGAKLVITPSQPGAALTVAAPTRTEVTSKQVASPKQLKSNEKTTTSAAKPQEIVATPKSTPFVISQSGAKLVITPSQPGAALTVAAPTRTEVTSKQVASPKQLQSNENTTTAVAKPQEIVATPKSAPFVISQSGAKLVITPSQPGATQIAAAPTQTAATPKQVAILKQPISFKQSPQQLKPTEKPQELVKTLKSAPFVISQSGAKLVIAPSQPGATQIGATPTQTKVTSKWVSKQPISVKQMLKQLRKTSTSVVDPQLPASTPKSLPIVKSQPRAKLDIPLQTKAIQTAGEMATTATAPKQVIIAKQPIIDKQCPQQVELQEKASTSTADPQQPVDTSRKSPVNDNQTDSKSVVSSHPGASQSECDTRTEGIPKPPICDKKSLLQSKSTDKEISAITDPQREVVASNVCSKSAPNLATPWQADIVQTSANRRTKVFKNQESNQKQKNGSGSNLEKELPDCSQLSVATPKRPTNQMWSQLATIQVPEGKGTDATPKQWTAPKQQIGAKQSPLQHKTKEQRIASSSSHSQQPVANTKMQVSTPTQLACVKQGQEQPATKKQTASSTESQQVLAKTRMPTIVTKQDPTPKHLICVIQSPTKSNTKVGTTVSSTSASQQLSAAAASVLKNKEQTTTVSSTSASKQPEAATKTPLSVSKQGTASKQVVTVKQRQIQPKPVVTTVHSSAGPHQLVVSRLPNTQLATKFVLPSQAMSTTPKTGAWKIGAVSKQKKEKKHRREKRTKKKSVPTVRTLISSQGLSSIQFLAAPKSGGIRKRKKDKKQKKMLQHGLKQILTTTNLHQSSASNMAVPSQPMFIQFAAASKQSPQKLQHIAIKPRPLQLKPKPSSVTHLTDPVSVIIRNSAPDPNALDEKERSKMIDCVKEGSTRNITELILVNMGEKFVPEICTSMMKRCAGTIGECTRKYDSSAGPTKNLIFAKTLDRIHSSNWTDICKEMMKLCPLLINVMVSVMLPQKQWGDRSAVEGILPRVGMVYALLLQAKLPNRSRTQWDISALIRDCLGEFKIMPQSSSHKFFMSGTAAEWETVHSVYHEVLSAKASKSTKPGGKKNLLDLDKWFQEELPVSIQDRKEKFITHEEITKLMKWKLSRGKFRPRLQEMVQSNSTELVESASKKAFKKLPNVASAIKELTVLKAVGPATASAVLAAGAPEHAPFMADESMLAIPGLIPLQYTPQFYARYVQQVKDCVKRLNNDDSSSSWTPHKVELTLWTHYMANKLDPSLLKETDTSAAKKRKSKPTKDGANGDAKKIKTET